MSIIKIVSNALAGSLSLVIMSTHIFAAVTPVPPPDSIPMTVSSINLWGPDVPHAPVLAEKSFTMQANELRRVFGRVEIVATTNGNMYVETYTQCALVGATASQSLGAAQNHEGKDTPVGPSYPWQGHLVLRPLLLFQAPTAGTYRCWLSGLNTQDRSLSAVATAPDGSSATYLEVSSASEAQTNKGSDDGWWQNPFCDEYGNSSPSPTSGHSSCLYLAGASNLKQLYVFDNDGSPANVWEAASDAAFVDASDSLMVTTCQYHTGSCTAENSQSFLSYYFWQDPPGTEVNSHMELIQLNSAGGSCKSYASPEQSTWVGDDPHHYMIYHSLSAIPVDPSCGSRKFRLRISVAYVYGNPVKIDGYNWTHAYAFTSFRGVAPPVPNLIGLTEGVARNYLATTGYAVSNVSYGLNIAPAGSVIFQYPSAGVIELPGSAVNFTVSTGGVIVPNLLGQSQSGAGATLQALGLVPSVSFSKACINPGDVLVQSPLSGTLVSSRSTVQITVDSGTLKSCILK